MSDLQQQLIEGIRTDFPVAGQDNSSQGFRENFYRIKNSLENTRLSVGELQVAQNKSTTVLPILVDNYNTDVTEDTLTIYFSDAEYQVITITRDNSQLLNISLTGTVDEIYSLVRLQIINESPTSQTITIIGNNVVSHVGKSISIPINGFAIFDCWTVDNGSTIMVNSLGLFTIDGSTTVDTTVTDCGYY